MPLGKKFLLELRKMKKIGAKIWPSTFEESIQEILPPHEGPDLDVPHRFVWIFSAETADTEAVASFHTTPTAEETAHARETADGTAATRGHAPDPPGAPPGAPILQEDAALVRAGAAINSTGPFPFPNQVANHNTKYRQSSCMTKGPTKSTLQLLEEP